MIQQDLFNLIDKGFCFDDDINNIVKMLDKIFDRDMVTEIKREWRIWEHVPDLGYRLSYYIYFDKPLTNKIFKEIEEVTKYGEDRNIEVTPFAYDFHKGDGSLSIYTIYKDKRINLK